MTDLLATELKTYAEKLETLLGTHEGKFVIIRGDQMLGTFDSQLDAIAGGYRQLGNVPFLVKQVVKIETPLNFVSNLLGV
jgi:hypothetical protein